MPFCFVHNSPWWIFLDKGVCVRFAGFLGNQCLFFGATVAALWVSPANAAELRIMVDVIPPYTNTLSPTLGQSRGLVVEVVEAAMLRAGMGVGRPAVVLPWRRAQVAAEKTPGALIFPFARTALREDKWKWVSVIVTDGFYIYTRKGRPVLSSLASLRHAGTVGVLAGGAPHSVATELKLNYEPVRNEESNFKKLAVGRVAAILSQGYMANAGMACVVSMASAGDKNTWRAEMSWVQRGSRVKALPLWLAASPGTPDADVARLRQAINHFKQTPQYAALLKKYEGKLPDGLYVCPRDGI